MRTRRSNLPSGTPPPPSLACEGRSVADDEGLAEQSTKRPVGRRLPSRGSASSSAEAGNGKGGRGGNGKKPPKKRVTVGEQTAYPAVPDEPLVRGSDASGEDNDVLVAGKGSRKRGARSRASRKPARRVALAVTRLVEETVTSENDESNSQDAGTSSSNDESSQSQVDDDDSEDVDDDDDDSHDEGFAVNSDEMKDAIALASEAAAKTFGWDKKKEHAENSGEGSRRQPGQGNSLSELIPGYTAPMRLETTYDIGRTMHPANLSLADLRRQAEATDASTARIVITSEEQRRKAHSMQGGAVSVARWRGVGNFKLGVRKTPDTTAGSNWFDMVPTAMTDELRTDLAVLRNRTYLDPKRFYKKSDRIDPRFVQVGTVVEGAGEYRSSRLTKKERRGNITEETMADPDVAGYTKKQFRKVQNERVSRSKRGYGSKISRKDRGPGGKKAKRGY